METQKNTLGTVALNDSARNYLLRLATFLENPCKFKIYF